MFSVIRVARIFDQCLGCGSGGVLLVGKHLLGSQVATPNRYLLFSLSRVTADFASNL